MLITFTVTGQKVRHDLGNRTLVAGSSGDVQADFNFDDSWEGYDTIIVFSNSNQQCGNVQPIRYEGEALNIPEKALKAGKLYVSVIGFAGKDKRRTTLKWDIQQAITVQECGAMGDCDILRNMVQVPQSEVASDGEFVAAMNEVFKGEYKPSEDMEYPEATDKVATEEEVQEMFAEVFGVEGSSPQKT